MARVVLEGVSKIYRSKGRVVEALRSLELVMEDGEFVTVLGPSGCGKTTLLSVIVGVVPPTTGRVVVDGVDVTFADPRERDMAMVFQNYALYPSKTVRRNLEFPLRVRGVPPEKRREQVQQIAVLLGLEGLLDQYPRQLSGGQQQRVALGRALIRRPKLFLMDEPLSNLDAKLRVQMRGEIKRLHREWPVTTIYVTHDQVEAMTLSDRVIVMDSGRVSQVGTPEEIYRWPANPFVADFVGAPPMNLLEVELEPRRGVILCREPRHGSVVGEVRTEERVQAVVGTLGIRPSQVDWRKRGGDGNDGWLRGVVTQIDDTGEDIVMYVEVLGYLVCVVERGGRKVAVGEEVEVRFPERALHVFVEDRRLKLVHERGLEPVRAMG